MPPLMDEKEINQGAPETTEPVATPEAAADEAVTSEAPVDTTPEGGESTPAKEEATSTAV